MVASVCVAFDAGYVCKAFDEVSQLAVVWLSWLRDVLVAWNPRWILLVGWVCVPRETVVLAVGEAGSGDSRDGTAHDPVGEM